MAKGVVHSKWTFRATVTQTLLLTYPVIEGKLPLLLAGSYVCGLVIGHLLTPDADQETITIEDARMGPAWTKFWMPYALEYRHRGPSHYFVRGTFTRWNFFSRRLFHLPLMLALQMIYYYPVSTLSFLGLCFAGNVAQDTIHLALDGFRTTNE